MPSTLYVGQSYTYQHAGHQMVARVIDITAQGPAFEPFSAMHSLTCPCRGQDLLRGKQ